MIVVVVVVVIIIIIIIIIIIVYCIVVNNSSSKVHIPSAYLEFVAYSLKILRRHRIFTCVLPCNVFVRLV
jgi:hypothetical protein